MDLLTELPSFKRDGQTNLFHGARYYELPWLLPRAEIPILDPSKAPRDTESILQSKLTQTLYFSRSQKIAAAYPMLERRSDIIGESPATLFPLGVIIITDEDLIKVRGLTTEEINLIENPDTNLLQHIRVADQPVRISAIKGVQLILYTSSFDTSHGVREYMSILTGDVESPSVEPTKHPEEFYQQLIQIKQRIRNAYPNIAVSLTKEPMAPDVALNIIKST